ncbi:MAG: DMT family transporter [Phototrophicaceae bacterium]|jgi:drug/metabolite transporter (DMT)-like permease
MTATLPPRRPPLRGVIAALLTPTFLGLAPIFGKLANQAGAAPFTVAAIRTLIAAAVLWVAFALFARRYLFIYPAGLTGCIIIGLVNGIGSLFFYSGLSLLDASLTQLINGSYLIFALFITRLDGERINRRVMVRVALAMLGLIIITGAQADRINWLGVGFMLANALMFAGTVILSQYVLFEMPSPTAALYIVTTMAVVVTMAWIPNAEPFPPGQWAAILTPIFWLGITTALARLTLFAGVKFMGSLQTAITALAEIGVSLLLAFLILGETLLPQQWVGVVILAISLLLIRQEDLSQRGFNPNALLVANMASLQFQKIAFHRAFGTSEEDNDDNTMSKLTTMEIHAIRDMMGVDRKPVDPFPIMKMHEGLTERAGGYSVDLKAFLEGYAPEGEE